ncbi:exopolyphosphatase [Tessaracoccus sp. MC1865]|uniref:Ppx/GppA phosphatase family protein n=1 Tax=Tessaracoccus sp. MC1865 TaxID=2760310 RepID=UPI001600D729|nr:exopolyphosphatase [Tessaracoccus sp. MC1865]MBB1482411.1 exopolyphosphatase [Tessaracoccus sp. MC1865]QTO38128.1 exopolyphosphatase [Tessaracoccus sp. MC1865]
MTTVAAVDCGTNSIRLLILRRGADGALTELAREVRLARLGQGVDATGEFHPDALQRANRIFEEFAAIIAGAGADRVRFVATSAARDVSNRAVFEANVRDRLGVGVDVISGSEEAQLSTLGVLSGVNVQTPSLVFDIGGGSTELIVVGEGPAILSAVSVNMGAVRLKERFLPGDPPSAAESRAARTFIAEQLDGAGVDFGSLAAAVGVAGTVTSFAAAKLGLETYHRESVHETVLARGDIEAILNHWLTQPAAVTAEEPCMHPLRAAVIGAGGLILDEISSRVPGGSVLVSETDILDGIALGLLEQ